MYIDFPFGCGEYYFFKMYPNTSFFQSIQNCINSKFDEMNQYNNNNKSKQMGQKIKINDKFIIFP